MLLTFCFSGDAAAAASFEDQNKNVAPKKILFTKNKHALNELKNPAGTKINVYDYLREKCECKQTPKRRGGEKGLEHVQILKRAIKVI